MASKHVWTTRIACKEQRAQDGLVLGCGALLCMAHAVGHGLLGCGDAAGKGAGHGIERNIPWDLRRVFRKPGKGSTSLPQVPLASLGDHSK